MTATVLSIIPPLLVLVFVLLTKRVILSITVGIVSAAFLLTSFDFGSTISTVATEFRNILYVPGEGISISNVYLISFLLLLGMITAYISASGGTQAFGEWAAKRVKSRVSAQLLTIVLGVIIFIDDYFNALTVGQVSRPLTDRYGVSRAKLAYLIDSTSAPICVVSPISSWGAYIIGLLGTIFATYELVGMSGFAGFIQIIPLNFYAIVSLALVVAVAYFNINIGSMKNFEAQASTLTTRNEKNVKGGTALNLLIPIGTLIVVAFATIFITGYRNSGEEVTIFSIVENADVYLGLVIGAVVSLVTAMAAMYKSGNRENFFLPLWTGAKSMFGAVYILVFAWTLTSLISQIGTGEYLSNLLNTMNINASFLPVILFVLSGIMAFATGTSWGTFGLMLPIGAQMVMTMDPELLLPTLAAVLAGAVFGDHCSPISDTTILSSTGAECDHVDHVTTQLPYAISAAIISALGFIVVGFTGSALIAIATVTVVFVAFIVIAKSRFSNVSEDKQAA